MRWQEQLPKWHPLHQEKDEMPMSPGTERAIVELARIAPKFTRELEKFNNNIASLLALGNMVLKTEAEAPAPEGESSDPNRP